MCSTPPDERCLWGQHVKHLQKLCGLLCFNIRHTWNCVCLMDLTHQNLFQHIVRASRPVCQGAQGLMHGDVGGRCNSSFSPQGKDGVSLKGNFAQP